MDVLILSWSAYGSGRARALLSLAEYVHRQGIDVTVVTGARGWPRERLATHHDIDLAGEWHRVEWGDTTAPDVARTHEPDVVISWDTILNTKARPLAVPTVGYCRTQAAVGLDEYWAPSKRVARSFTDELDGRDEPAVRPVYPTWYIEPLQRPLASDSRPIDVMLHGRKARDAVSALNPTYNVLLANRFGYPALREMYQQTKLFVFPRPERFEPLGLMPIEAVAHGCRVAVPENSGVAETMPEHAYEDPLDHVDDLLTADDTTYPTVPESPTNPADRFRRLAS